MRFLLSGATGVLPSQVAKIPVWLADATLVIFKVCDGEAQRNARAPLNAAARIGDCWWLLSCCCWFDFCFLGGFE